MLHLQDTHTHLVIKCSCHFLNLSKYLQYWTSLFSIMHHLAWWYSSPYLTETIMWFDNPPNILISVCCTGCTSFIYHTVIVLFPFISHTLPPICMTIPSAIFTKQKQKVLYGKLLWKAFFVAHSFICPNICTPKHQTHGIVTILCITSTVFATTAHMLITIGRTVSRIPAESIVLHVPE